MKKAITALLCILIISSCASKPVEPVEPVEEDIYDASIYVKQLKEMEEREKNKENTTDNAEFEELLEGVFEEMAVADFLEFHYNIYDYKALGLEKPEAALNQYKYEPDRETIAYYRELLEEMRTYDYNSLSYDQQYDYDCLEFECLCKLASLCFYRYKFYLKEGESVLDDVASYFIDYSFNDEESITDYLNCLKDIERAYNEVLDYTAKQAQDGYPMLDEWIDYIEEICESFCSTGDKNDMIVSFDQRIDKVTFLDDTKKSEYKAQNKQIVNDVLVPVYKKVSEEVEKYRGMANIDDYALCNIDKDYAEFVYIKEGSNNFEVSEMLEYVTDALSTLEAEYLSCLFDDDSYQIVLDASEGKIETFNLSLEDTIKYLEEHVSEYFPAMEPVEYTIQYLDPESAPESVIAYYWQAPVDEDNQNIIRVNPNYESDYVYKTYTTMAHEGIPGHLYQLIYYHRQRPSKFRMLLFNLAYLEGWAEYSSLYSLKMAGLNDEYAPSLLFYDTDEYFLVYTIVDILANYYGYSGQQIYDYLQENFVLTEEYDYTLENCEILKEIMIECSGQYVPYGVGLSFMLELRDAIANVKGEDFDIIEYNKAILDSGMMPLNILKQSVCEKLNVER